MSDNNPTDERTKSGHAAGASSRTGRAGAISRRGFLASSVLAATLAGCSSGTGTSTTTASGGAGTSTTTMSGGQGTTETSTPTATETQSIEAWRQEMKEKAREELKGDEKLEVWGQSPPIEPVQKLFNGYAIDEALTIEEPPFIDDDDPWAPLRDNVSVVATGTTKQAETYRRQVKTNSIQKDILTTSYLPVLIKQGVPVTDLSDIPSWQQQVPEHLKKLTTKIGYFRGKSASIAYNTETVSDPPKNIADLLDSRFDDKKIGIDLTPTPTIPYALLEKYGDEVSPRLQSAGADMTGSEFVKKLGNQNTSLSQSAYKMLLNTGSGKTDIAFGGPMSVLYDLRAEGTPIKPVKHPSAHFLRPKGVGISSNPPHPAAAKLFVDYLLTNRSVQLAKKGVLSVDYEKSNPKGAVDWIMADWQTPYAQMAIDTKTKKLRDMWQKTLDVPTV